MAFLFACDSVVQPTVFHTWVDSSADLDFLWQVTDSVNRSVSWFATSFQLRFGVGCMCVDMCVSM